MSRINRWARLLRIETEHGVMLARARLYPGTMPDQLALPLGFGRVVLNAGRWRVGDNADTLFGLETDPLSGLRVRVGVSASLSIAQRHEE